MPLSRRSCVDVLPSWQLLVDRSMDHDDRIIVTPVEMDVIVHLMCPAQLRDRGSPLGLCILWQNPKARPVRLVDVPGHPRLRGLVDPLLQRASAVVFLVDALDFMPHIRANAE